MMAFDKLYIPLQRKKMQLLVTNITIIRLNNKQLIIKK